MEYQHRSRSLAAMDGESQLEYEQPFYRAKRHNIQTNIDINGCRRENLDNHVMEENGIEGATTTMEMKI